MQRLNQVLFVVLLMMSTVLWAACGQGNTASSEGGEQSSSQEQATAGQAGQESGKSKSKAGEIKFSSTEHDFGTVKQGEKVKHSFEFKNIGNGPIKLSKVKPSCGCTSPHWTKDPVQPGGTGVVDVEFNSAGKSGKQRKSVTVFTESGEKPHVLRFTAQVKK
jgi:hypothetical protein